MISRRRHATRLTFIGAIVAMTGALIAPLGVSAATPPIRFSIAIASPGDCFAVITVANTPTSVTLRDAGGLVKFQTTLPADEIFACLPASMAIVSGDKLRASDGSYARTLTVPNLSIVVDRAADLFTGTGPAGRTIRIEYPAGIFADYGRTHSIRVGQDGHWTFAPNQDLIGGLNGSAWWKSPNDDQIYTNGAAPQITVTLGKSKFSGWTEPFNEIDVDLDGTPDATGHATAGVNGSFSGQFRNAQGHRRPVEAGDHLAAPSIAPDADWIVPQIEVSANTVTDVVTGRCFDTGNGSGTAIVEDHRTGRERGFVILGTENDGSFEFDFGEVGNFYADPANVKHGDTLVVRCMMDTGDWVQLRSLVP